MASPLSFPVGLVTILEVEGGGVRWGGEERIIITAARTKYNNMDQEGIWNKVDPRDAKIMALTTMVKTMKGNKKPNVHGNGGTAL